MGRNSRCGKRPKPLSELGLAVKEEIALDGICTVTHYKDGKKIGKGIAGETAPRNSVARCLTDTSGDSLEHGQAVAPATLLTVFVKRNRRALRKFCRKWIGKGFRIKQCIKNGAALPDQRGVAFSVNGGSPELVPEMLRDEYLGGWFQAIQSRCALGSGEFARKPRDKSGTVRKQIATRVINGSKVYVRI